MLPLSCAAFDYAQGPMDAKVFRAAMMTSLSGPANATELVVAGEEAPAAATAAASSDGSSGGSSGGASDTVEVALAGGGAAVRRLVTAAQKGARQLAGAAMPAASDQVRSFEALPACSNSVLAVFTMIRHLLWSAEAGIRRRLWRPSCSDPLRQADRVRPDVRGSRDLPCILQQPAETSPCLPTSRFSCKPLPVIARAAELRVSRLDPSVSSQAHEISDGDTPCCMF